jgi:UPF0755 protein
VRQRLIGFILWMVPFLLVSGSMIARLQEPIPVRADAALKLPVDTDLDGVLRQLGSVSAHVDESRLRWIASLYKMERFRAGRYEIDSTVSTHRVLRRWVRGEQDPLRLRIQAARFQHDLVGRISSQMRFEPSELDSVLSDSSFLAELGVDRHHVIGRILPDTYEFYWTASAEEVVRRVHQTFHNRVTVPYASRLDSLGWTVDDATTMASIIEWEVRHVDEMARVSGLYWNRLRRNMPLQADPTVNYALGERRRLFHSDYRYDHPYNTYRIRGLPPGPLNNPRLVAIEAALYPESHPYLFMVATAEGYHTFTRTFDEHKMESRKWVRWLNEQVKARQEREANRFSSTMPR